jgi:23S rRNA (adenine2503-C2)-methyltransferase
MAGYRAGQILEWVYHKGVDDPSKMSNLSVRERELLSKKMVFTSGQLLKQQHASDGTSKLLVGWRDYSEEGTAPEQGIEAAQAEEPSTESSPRRLKLSLLGETKTDLPSTETVMIPAESETALRRTACISSQVGCPVGCKFCASGIGGLEMNLSGGRIVEQVWLLRQMLRSHPVAAEPTSKEDAMFPRITNVVFMGMGEPLANFAAVMHAVKVITSPWGHNISARKVTISTVGLPAAIEKLAEQCDVPLTLALSLHAPTDALRRELIPWAEYSTIEQLLGACSKWFAKTGREVTLEYTLLANVNDREEHAWELAKLAKSLRANVNLIRYNENPGLPFGRPKTDDVLAFQEVLVGSGINTHIRASRGRDIAAACGQLRHEEKKGKKD